MRKFSDEEKKIKREISAKKNSIRFTGKGNPRYGIKMSQETKDKISKALKGIINEYNKIGINNVKSLSPEGLRKIISYAKSKSRQIYQLDFDGNIIREWDSISNAAKSFGKISISCDITRACQGKTNSVYGFKWKYKQDLHNI